MDAGGCTLDGPRKLELARPVYAAMTFFTSDDDTIPHDTRDVLAASSLLQITEFQLFELAYERWFDRQAKERELEARFAARCVGAIMPLPTMPNR
jgi:hypothetical protein